MSTQQPDIYTKIAETDSTTPASFAWHVQNGTKPIHPSVTPPPIISVAHVRMSAVNVKNEKLTLHLFTAILGITLKKLTQHFKDMKVNSGFTLAKTP